MNARRALPALKSPRWTQPVKSLARLAMRINLVSKKRVKRTPRQAREE